MSAKPVKIFLGGFCAFFAFFLSFFFNLLESLYLENGNSLPKQCQASFREEGGICSAKHTQTPARTHTNTHTQSHNQNRRSEVKLGHPTLPSLFRPSLSSFLLRQSVLSSNTTPLVKHTHTYHLDTVQPPTTAHKTVSSIH